MPVPAEIQHTPLCVFLNVLHVQCVDELQCYIVRLSAAALVTPVDNLSRQLADISCHSAVFRHLHHTDDVLGAKRLGRITAPVPVHCGGVS